MKPPPLKFGETRFIDTARAGGEPVAITGFAKFAKVACAGPLLVNELVALETALEKPKRPLIAIVERARELGTLGAGEKKSARAPAEERARRPDLDIFVATGDGSHAFAETLARGRALGKMKISNALFEEALNGNVRAMIFFLKARDGWCETQSRPYAVPPLEEEQREMEARMHNFNQAVTRYLRGELGD